ncbi:MAG: COX15/CtaA family protein [Bacteroidota bacterium]
MDQSSTIHSGPGRWVVRWYVTGALLIAVTLVIGGVTRLTDSGLSMVEWKPILGVVPPVSEQGWEEAFDMYKAYPEYQQHNRGMSLDEFQFIYFWEYLHRMSGRALGMVFLIPFGLFLVKGWPDRRERRRSLLLLALGLSQGFMGWFMVSSGLVDVPWVSHFRLAAHLMLAVFLFAVCVWFALDLSNRLRQMQFREVQPVSGQEAARRHSLQKILWGVLTLTALQMVWGAFVAGLHAGHIYNTFPLMAGQWIPAGMGQSGSFWLDLSSNPATVQWVHRVLGTLLLLWTGRICWRVFRNPPLHGERRMAFGLLLLILVQYLLGIVTLLTHVPLLLGVLHQFAALVLVGYLVLWMHRLHSARMPWLPSGTRRRQPGETNEV